ncbi:distal membrane-arm assembly complex protein 2-like isoform X5 [Pseudophryne corroboree]|uniref:distal membrane-arm assembly complex protein 2-like isoform X5 n=1 Tax=Pseudophryne corroboree TaxID=495146 RepID=UPI00308196B8
MRPTVHHPLSVTPIRGSVRITWLLLDMAAPRLLQSVRLLRPMGHGCIRHSSSYSFPKVKQKVEQYLRSNSPAFVALLNWNIRYKYWKLQNSNQQVIYTGELYGKNAAAAHYILTNEGAVRFKGHTQWYQHKGGRFSWDFLQHKDLPVECVDLSGSTVDYLCLSNIVSLHDLRYLNLSRCPYIDDWALSRLHAFQDSLEVLSLAGCPRVTERGLATLHHLQHLKHLDLTDLPSVNNKGLIRILLEEVIPACEIVGIEYTDGLETGEVRAPEMTSLQP